MCFVPLVLFCVFFWGLNAASIDISSFSCTGDNVCAYLGSESASSIEIGTGSCKTDEVELCSYAAQNTIVVEFGNDSCIGDQACFHIGRSADNVYVGSNTCNGIRACYKTEEMTTGNITICNGEDIEQNVCNAVIVDRDNCDDSVREFGESRGAMRSIQTIESCDFSSKSPR